MVDRRPRRSHGSGNCYQSGPSQGRKLPHFDRGTSNPASRHLGTPTPNSTRLDPRVEGSATRLRIPGPRRKLGTLDDKSSGHPRSWLGIPSSGDGTILEDLVRPNETHSSVHVVANHGHLPRVFPRIGLQFRVRSIPQLRGERCCRAQLPLLLPPWDVDFDRRGTRPHRSNFL